MIRVLRSGRRAAASGAADSLVVFLHGYGADGADLLGLSVPLARGLPGAAFAAPDAPEACAASPAGLQWFPIPWIDGSREEDAERAAARAAADLDAYLDRAMEEEGVGPDRTLLFGFSQGAMMALHVAPRRAAAFAGVVGCSGRLMAPGRLAAEAASRPPVLLMHGDADEVVPPASMPEARDALAAAGFEVRAHVMGGTGHGISPDGLAAALAFMLERLGAR